MSEKCAESDRVGLQIQVAGDPAWQGPHVAETAWCDIGDLGDGPPAGRAHNGPGALDDAVWLTSLVCSIAPGHAGTIFAIQIQRQVDCGGAQQTSSVSLSQG